MILFALVMTLVVCELVVAAAECTAIETVFVDTLDSDFVPELLSSSSLYLSDALHAGLGILALDIAVPMAYYDVTFDFQEFCGPAYNASDNNHTLVSYEPAVLMETINCVNHYYTAFDYIGYCAMNLIDPFNSDSSVLDNRTESGFVRVNGSIDIVVDSEWLVTRKVSTPLGYLISASDIELPPIPDEQPATPCPEQPMLDIFSLLVGLLLGLCLTLCCCGLRYLPCTALKRNNSNKRELNDKQVSRRSKLGYDETSIVDQINTDFTSVSDVDVLRVHSQDYEFDEDTGDMLDEKKFTSSTTTQFRRFKQPRSVIEGTPVQGGRLLRISSGDTPGSEQRQIPLRSGRQERFNTLEALRNIDRTNPE